MYSALFACQVKGPVAKQWFRFLVIFLPVVSFPLYQLASPGRGNVYFRIDSLLDSYTWLYLDLWGGIPLLAVFIGVVAISAVIFFIQEFIPIVSQMIEQMRGDGEASAEIEDSALAAKLREAIEGLPIDAKLVEVIDDEDLVLYSRTGLDPRIYISTGLIDSFSPDHLQVAIAHEIGHIRRRKRPVLILAYVLRALMFFNPVAMIEFRKLAQEEEKVCDDIAIELTGKPDILAESIEMLRPAPEEYDTGTAPSGVGGIASSLEHYSHDVLLRGRIERIGRETDAGVHWVVPYFVTAALIIGINYFIV